MLAEPRKNDPLDTGTQSPALSQRRSRRVALGAKVMLRRSGQNNYRVNVYDISPHGCRVEFVERLDLEELLWVKFERLDALEASVCWTRAPLAGLRFSRPI